MARSSSSTLIEWGGILVLAFLFVPKLLAGLKASNARTATQYSPGAAAQAQAARAVNTAGLVGNTALANILSQLLGRGGQQQGSGRSSGASSGGGGALSPPRTSTTANDRDPFGNLSQLINIRRPGEGITPQPSAADLTPPTIDFGPQPIDWGAIFGTPSLPIGPEPDLSALNFGGDLSGLFSVFGTDAASLASPDLQDVDGLINFDYNSFFPDVGISSPDTSYLDYGGDLSGLYDFGGFNDLSSFSDIGFDAGGGGFDYGDFGGDFGGYWNEPFLEEVAF